MKCNYVMALIALYCVGIVAADEVPAINCIDAVTSCSARGVCNLNNTQCICDDGYTTHPRTSDSQCNYRQVRKDFLYNCFVYCTDIVYGTAHWYAGYPEQATAKVTLFYLGLFFALIGRVIVWICDICKEVDEKKKKEQKEENGKPKIKRKETSMEEGLVAIMRYDSSYMKNMRNYHTNTNQVADVSSVDNDCWDDPKSLERRSRRCGMYTLALGLVMVLMGALWTAIFYMRLIDDTVQDGKGVSFFH